MNLEKEIIQIGSSLAVIIPQPAVKAMGLKKGDSVEISASSSSIKITPSEKFKKIKLRGLFKSRAKETDFKKARHTLKGQFEKRWKKL